MSPLLRRAARRDTSPATGPATPGVRRPGSPGTDVALVAVFAALVCALAITPALQVGGSGVPITLQTLGIMLCGAVLGPWRGALAVLLYLVLGFAGAPVFAQGASGLGVLAAPSAGFLLAMPLAALVIGALVRAGVRAAHRTGRRVLVPVSLVAGCLLGGIAVVYAGGIPGLALNGAMPLDVAARLSLTFLPGDLVKVALTVLVAAPVHRAFPHLLDR
ncbi:biotin transporter BioY [Kineococcus terrestris]|uniref:biotin transporter BioY n=1 Tax=Kineococcus terrestris TaxID=2044856 RepID=UPI0034DAF4F3